MPVKHLPSTNSDRYKIILFGPRAAGKSTNLKAIERALAQPEAGAQTEPASGESRQIELPARGSLRMPLVLHAVTAASDSAWTTTMRGLHGLIFVADSAQDRFEENIAAMAELIDKLAYFRIKIDHFPIIVQYNKRDLEDATSVARLEERLNPLGLPAFSAVAKDGIGACECVRAINLLIEKQKKPTSS